MNLSLSVGTRFEFDLHTILLYYEGKGNDERARAFVTEHRPTVIDGVLECGPGKLVTKEFLASMVRSLNQGTGMQFLPPHVLASGSSGMAWWIPARKRAMFFGENEQVKGLSGQIFPHPALLLLVVDNHLYLRALEESTRPTEDTEIFVAPYWNTEPTRGSVCTGSMTRPATTSPETLEIWEEGFFDSKFTHASGGGYLTKHTGGFAGLWQELAGQETFPSKYLYPTKQTVGQFLKGATRGSYD